MRVRHRFELPPDKQDKLKQAVRLEWISILFIASIILVVGLSMGSSQAMRTAWIEDCLSLVPPLVFLLGVHFRAKAPNERFPYGHRRFISIAFLTAALALLTLGALLVVEAAVALATREHPTIGTVSILGWDLWLGWLMIAALAYSAVPPVVLGRMKLPLSHALHEKVLHTDATMNKADWMTAVAGILGILGVGMGWWWADATAAGIISFDILREGLTNVKQGLMDLMDKRPTTIEDNEPDPLVRELRDRLESLDWVQAAEVRLREEGDVYTGEVFLIPRDERHPTARISEAGALARALDWRIYDVVVTLVRRIEPDPSQQA